jgi:CHAT domain-containing protein
LRRRLDELEASRSEIVQWGRLQDPRFAAVDPGEPATPRDVQELLLAPDAALLEYALGDTVSYALVVTPDSLTLVPLPPRDRIATLVQALRAAVDADAGRLRGRRLAPDAPAPDLASAASRLGDAVLAPVMPALWRSRRLLVVPDGPLQFVPFELLLTGVGKKEEDPGRWPYALRSAVVSYGPSATSLLNLAAWRAEREGAAEGFLGVGDPDFKGAGEPLPFTRTEVERIGALFGERDRVLLMGNLAKEKTLTEPGFLSRFRFIHLATHGVADELRPERSRLALSSPEDASEDGYLQASEVYDVQLQADLVVLSACETGRGKMVQGEGVMGLPRAFLYAGTPAVVVSLWSVSDEATADLMSAFYEGMVREGLAPAEALARAKERLRAGTRWAHPFYWAPFVLVGAP